VTFRAGLARADLTHVAPRTALFGWGIADNVPTGVGAPLAARALVIEDGARRRFALVVCDLGMISTALRREVERRALALGLVASEAALMLAATHTHSGPSGHAAHLLFAAAAPGFFPELVDVLADGIVAALREAALRLEDARLFAGTGLVPLDAPVAWNRALSAYNANEGVVPVRPGREAEAVDRRMTVLRVDARTGRPLGLVSWFGLHATAIHSDRRVVHPDHKGLAAARFEASETSGFVAIFAQGAAGDVTPNRRASPRGFDVGESDDDFESARMIAEVEVEVARGIAARLGPSDELAPHLAFAMERRDFFAAPVSSDHAGGRRAVTTTPPSLGLGFLSGTREGPGWLGAFPELGPRAASLARRFGLDPPRLVQLGVGARARFLGILPANHPVFRLVPSERVRWFAREVNKRGGEPWVPRYLPGQIVRLGGRALTIVGLPVEPTTIAAQRIERTLRGALGERVVVAGYVNDYASYLTTPEEFDVQRYEGAASLYGRHALGAWCTWLDELSASCAP